MVRDPSVSIVIPCYNDEARIANAIESSLGQSYNPVEVIVVNDGSTDESEAVIAAYEDQIRYLETENHGACHPVTRD
jgi:glycosyltransferase involved in cell wall biosynthesis